MHGPTPSSSPPDSSSRVFGLRQGILIGAVLILVAVAVAIAYRAFGVPGPLESAEAEPARLHVSAARYADFGSHTPASSVRHLANWIADARDNADAVFFVIDKHDARLYAFDRDARLLASSAVLLGAARGDDSVPGIGTRPMAMISVHERTTPAGRFVAEQGHNTQGEDVVWVDYDAAVSMHRVRTTNPAERRLERLATPDVTDNRISYGCVNVPAAFYDAHVRPRFAATTALVYVLPEVKPVRQVFGSYDVVPRTVAINNSIDNVLRTFTAHAMQE